MIAVFHILGYIPLHSISLNAERIISNNTGGTFFKHFIRYGVYSTAFIRFQLFSGMNDFIDRKFII